MLGCLIKLKARQVVTLFRSGESVAYLSLTTRSSSRINRLTD